jgi:hypothetical protein
MRFSLALVSGANSGLGLALCHLLADQKISLIITARDSKRLEAAAEDLRKKVPVEILQADLGDAVDREKVIKLIQEKKPDLVINNAGFGLYNDAIDHSVKEQIQMVEVNCNAVLQITLESAKVLRDSHKKGTILNVSSVAGFFVFPYFSVYAASKSFVNELTQSLDLELKDKGIRVLAACPGMIDTAFRQNAGGSKKPHDVDAMSPEFAAKEIWKQIETGKTIHIFSWKYRLAVIAKKFIPQWIYVKFLINNIKNRCK